MAIQVRRGNYADLDISRLVQGEPFVTLDETPTGGYYVGMAISANNVVRLATFDDLTDIKQDCEDARDEAVTSATNAASSESNSEAWAVGERGGVPVSSDDVTYQNNAKYYSDNADAKWTLMDNALDVVTPTVAIDFDTGILSISGSFFDFSIDNTTGHLMWNLGD